MVSGGHIAEHLRLVGLGVDPLRFERALELRFVEISAVPFDVGLATLDAFVAREGHARVRIDHVEGGHRLGEWMATQRAWRRSGRLRPDRAAALERIPGWIWEPLAYRWSVAVAALRTFAAREGYTRVPDSHVEGRLRLGEWVVTQRIWRNAGRLDPARTAELESLPGWSWDPVADDWNDMLNTLRSFAVREGHARVAASHLEGDLRLGSWVAAQRSRRRMGRLDPASIAELESVPGWTWNPRTVDWDAALAALRAFVAREGHARVPRAHIESGVALGSWVVSHRHRRDRLERARILELEAIPGWTWDRGTDEWETALAALRAFVAREGHARVPSDYVDGNVRLGRWVIKRRADRKAGRLTPTREADLEAIPGWTWDPYGDDWETGLAALRTFAAREGHARVPQRYVDGDFRLGIWVSGRRVDRNRGRLDAARVAALEAIPGWVWEPFAEGWHDNLAALQAFVEREGHARVSAAHLEGRLRLGRWVSHQRSEYGLGRLDLSRAAELEAIPGWTWNPPKVGAARPPASRSQAPPRSPDAAPAPVPASRSQARRAKPS